MLRSAASLAAVLTFALAAPGQQGGSAPVALTIYNQDFAVVRTSVALDLKSGANEVTTSNVTSQLEPDSVVLRDPSGKTAFQVVEQNYDAGIIDQNSLLQKFEGKTIQFQTYAFNLPGGIGAGAGPAVVDGKVIRAGSNGSQPLIEVAGHLEFQLPGTPLFPASTDGLLLKPTLRWQIDSPHAARLGAELAYITRGMSWQATYNVVAADSSTGAESEPVDLLGWITMQNNTGTDFPEARIKLMAGDVAKIRNYAARNQDYVEGMAVMAAPPAVTQQAFDDFHLYDLNRTVSLANKETKQVEFLDASGITMHRVYEYDGATPTNYNLCLGCHNEQPGFGTASGTKVNVRAEISNSAANHLGMPLPAGRIRLYRRDSAGQMEFIGEGTIPHTPAEETVKVPVGSAFDVTGERKQTDFLTDQRARTTDETFSITVKNQKSIPVRVAIVEHMNRSQNWRITQKSTDFTKRDSSTIEFPVTVPAAGEVNVTYSVRYTW